MTDKDTEALLIVETRDLADREGAVHAIEMPRLYWRSLDLLTYVYHLTINSVLLSAKLASETHNVDLSTGVAFHAARYHRWYCDILDGNVPFAPPMCPLAYRTDSSRKMSKK